VIVSPLRFENGPRLCTRPSSATSSTSTLLSAFASTVPLSSWPLRSRSAFSVSRGGRLVRWAARRARNSTTGHCGLITWRSVISGSKPMLRWNAPSNSRKGVGADPNASIRASRVATEIGETKKHSPPL
jgi:hypothetical protein